MIEEVKIVFIDLDGTLLNKKKETSQYTNEVIKKITQKGIKVVLCSGRANSDMIELSQKANCSKIVISSNGAMVFDYGENKKIYENKINLEESKLIWDFAKENDMTLTYNLTYERLANKKSEKKSKIIQEFREMKDDVTQIVVDSHNIENMEKLQELINKKYDKLECRNLWEQVIDENNNKNFQMDITNKCNNKGEAIKMLLETQNINREYTMCFGDEMGDLPMFNACNIKVAMINGNEKLKEKADYITQYDNNEDGVAKFLEEKLLK